MKSIRYLLIAGAVVAVLLISALVVAFNSGFQTWVARKALASQPGLQASVGRVSIGLGSVSLRDVEFRQDGALLRMPSLELRLPVWKAAFSRIQLEQVTAEGWTLDLSAYRVASSASKGAAKPLASSEFSLFSTAMAAGPSQVADKAFPGLFPLLVLPVDLSLDALRLRGELLAPGLPGQTPLRVAVSVDGGGLRQGAEAAFDVELSTKLGAQSSIDSLRLLVKLQATMDSPRTFSRVSTRLEALATGPQLPERARLVMQLQASRKPDAESYLLTLSSADKTLLDLNASLPIKAARLSGSWSIDLSESDFRPFAMGRKLPLFEAEGKGTLSSDLAGLEQVLSGRLDASCGRLETLDARLASLGALQLKTVFDLTASAQTLRITRLEAELEGTSPFLSLRTLQGFEFSPLTGALKVADPSKDLMRLNLLGLPLALGQGMLPDLTISNGVLGGTLVLKAHEGGFALRSESPLRITNLGLSQAGKPLVDKLDMGLKLSGDYTPQGWQLKLEDFGLQRQGKALLGAGVRLGQLNSRDTAIKLQGDWKADLAVLFELPLFAKAQAKPSKGKVQGDFKGSLGKRQELQADVVLSELLVPKLQAQPLPSAVISLRADLEADGSLTLNAPLKVTNAARKRSSDFVVTGTLKPGADARHLDVHLTSQSIHLEDLQILAAPFAVAEEAAPASPAVQAKAQVVSRDEAPFWKGLVGRVVLQMKQTQLNDQFAVSDLQGALLVEPKALRLETITARLGASGSLTCDARIDYESGAQPYSFDGALTVNDLDSKGLLGEGGAISPAVEARFNVTSRFASTGRNLPDLLAHTTGQFNLLSKGGTCRLLRTDIADLFSSKQGGGGLGSLAAGLLGAKEGSKTDEALKMAIEIAEYCSGIPFDQLSVSLTRDEKLNASLQDFSLISPMIRLTGEGMIRHQEGLSLVDQPMELVLNLSARGRLAENFRKADLLQGEPDNLGYASLKMPLRVRGTLAKPDTNEFKAILKKIALAKVGDALLDRLLGR